MNRDDDIMRIMADGNVHTAPEIAKTIDASPSYVNGRLKHLCKYRMVTLVKEKDTSKSDPYERSARWVIA